MELLEDLDLRPVIIPLAKLDLPAYGLRCQGPIYSSGANIAHRSLFSAFYEVTVQHPIVSVVTSFSVTEL